MAANFAHILQQLQLKLERQQAAVKATEEHMDAIKALQRQEEAAKRK